MSLDNPRCADCKHYWADHNTDDSCALCGCDWYRDADVDTLAQAFWADIEEEE